MSDSHKVRAEYRLRNKWMTKYIDYLVSKRVNANILSFLGFLFSIIAAIFLSIGSIYWPPLLAFPAPFFIIIGGLFDILDGEVARRTGNDSSLGAFLDSTLDRFSDAIIILGLILGGLLSFLWGYFFLFFSLMIPYARSRAENEGLKMKGIGIMERGERIILLSAALIAETWIYAAGWKITGKPWVVKEEIFTSIPVTPFFLTFMIFYFILLVITCIQRLVFPFKNSNQNKDLK
ncbi:MAG: CDP-alcohol phosphatidyltransferase family protein [Promethearchaeia archaeon]